MNMKQIPTPSSPLALYEAVPAGPPAEGIDENVPLVLGHALGSNRHMWDEAITLLPRNLSVLVWEQPGHGHSALLSASDPSAADTAAALHDALADAGVSAAHIAGLSLGGMVSLAYAQAYPQDTVSLSVLDSGPALPPSSMWRERATQVDDGGLSSLVEGTMERWFTPEFASGDGAEAVKKIRSIFLSTSPAGYAQCCRVIANTDLTSGVDTTQKTTLVLTGAGDLGTPPADAQALATLISDGPAIIVEDARHLTAVEQPEAVVKALVERVTGGETSE